MRRPLSWADITLVSLTTNLVAGLEPLRQIGDDAVAQHAVGLHHQHPRGIARARRAQRDAVGGKFEIEEIGAHGAMSLLLSLHPSFRSAR